MIEPGSKFTIEYGNGHLLEVTCLAGSQQTRLAKALAKAAASEGNQDIVGMFTASQEALELCVGKEAADVLWDDHVDAEMAMDIAGKTLGKQALSDEDKKKLESPSLSDAESYADRVAINANTITSEV